MPDWKITSNNAVYMYEVAMMYIHIMHDYVMYALFWGEP